jgi:hypothetical protein
MTPSIEILRVGELGPFNFHWRGGYHEGSTGAGRCSPPSTAERRTFATASATRMRTAGIACVP